MLRNTIYDIAIKGKLLGSGYYSKVYSIPSNPDAVLKIANRDACLIYYQWILSLPKSERKFWMPKIYQLIDMPSDHIYAVFMKKYDKQFPEDHEKQEFRKLCQLTLIEPLVEKLESLNLYNNAYGYEGGRRAKAAGIEELPYTDIHNGNIMYDPQLKCGILTDPLAGDYVIAEKIPPLFKNIIKRNYA